MPGEHGRTRRRDPLQALVPLVLGAAFVWAIGLRLVSLDNIPGINGDEAWYGVQMQELAAKGTFTADMPTGRRLLNPFHAGPLYLLQAIFPPAFWILRLPAVLSGVLLVALGHVLLRRVLSSQVALLSTFLLAVLPVNIASSRFGWDPSQSALLGLIGVYFALAGNVLATAAAYLLSLLVHPTNIFIAPTLAGPFLARRVEAWQRKRVQVTMRGLLRIEWVALLLVVAAMATMFRSSLRPFLWPMRQRIFNLDQWVEYARFCADLFSGLTTYRFIAGEPGPVMSVLHLSAVTLFALTAVVLGAPRLLRKRDSNEIGLLVGASATALLYFLVVGPRAPERYALFLVVPTVLCLSVFLASATSTPRGRTCLRLGVGALGCLLLLSFSWNYFRAIIVTGGRAHRTFRTASVEPKAGALSLIRTQAGAGAPLTIVADEWWIYWPIRYLAATDGSITVVRLAQPGEIPEALARGAFLVGLPGGPADHFLRGHGGEARVRSWVIPSYAGDPAVLVWQHADAR